jgi:hypothetical protein
MYQLEKIKTSKRYQRDFEGMGEGLVLLKVESEVKNIGYNFHLFYRNGKKPPLDIAINPDNFSIEYVSLFLQDELIKIENSLTEIIYKDENLLISYKDFTIDNTNLNFKKDFDIHLFENSLIILDVQVKKEVYGYLLSGTNYILVDENNNIVGLAFKNISKNEMDILKDAKVI